MKAIFFGFLVLAACVAFGVTRPGHWSVVIVAGSAQQHVFDNATKRFQDKIDAKGVESKRFTSDIQRAGIKNGVHLPFATLDGIELSLTRASGPCMLYITSHGAVGGFVDVGRQVLTPMLLNDIIGRSCGKKPGVLIVSACYSGEYMRLKLLRPNWTILTASAEDRTSFGCTNDLTYTYWDGCFLEAVDSGERRWDQIYQSVKTCVARLESQMKIPLFQRSQPMFYQGKNSPKEVPW